MNYYILKLFNFYIYKNGEKDTKEHKRRKGSQKA